MSVTTSGLKVPRPTGGSLTRQAWIRLAVIAALFMLVYGRTIQGGLINRWIQDANWSHGWLIPLFSLYFLNSRRAEMAAVPIKTNYLGAVILAGSLAIFLLCVLWLRMGYPKGLSMITALLGLTLLMGGWGLLRIVWFPIVFLIFAIPLPESIYFSMTFQLQKIAASVSSGVLPLLVPGLHTEAQAVVIDYVLPGMPPGQLNVQEACSGMRSSIAFAALGVAMAYLNERPLWQRLVMVASCLPIAIFCNAIRVIVTGWLQVTGHEELARGTTHEMLGVLMFVVALGLFSLIGYVLANLWIEDSEETSSVTDGTP